MRTHDQTIEQQVPHNLNGRHLDRSEPGSPASAFARWGGEPGVPDERTCSLGWRTGVPGERFCSLGWK